MDLEQEQQTHDSSSYYSSVTSIRLITLQYKINAKTVDQ